MRRRTDEMHIGELSRRTGVSARSLRYYEQRGLLRADRAANGYREYDETAVIRAANIRHLLDTGLTIEHIRDPMDKGCLDRPLGRLPLCEGSLQAATDRLVALDRRIDTLLELRERLALQLAQTRADLGQAVGN